MRGPSEVGGGLVSGPTGERGVHMMGPRGGGGSCEWSSGGGGALIYEWCQGGGWVLRVAP